MSEEWRDIQGFEGYQVSNRGRVKSIKQILKPFTTYSGYKRVKIYKDKKGKQCFIQILVLEGFHSPRMDGYQAHHIDRNRGNNSISNLEWVKIRDHQKLTSYAKGSACYGSKLIEENVREIRKDFDCGISSVVLAKRFHVSKCTIHNIVKRLRWRHVE